MLVFVANGSSNVELSLGLSKKCNTYQSEQYRRPSPSWRATATPNLRANLTNASPRITGHAGPSFFLSDVQRWRAGLALNVFKLSIPCSANHLTHPANTQFPNETQCTRLPDVCHWICAPGGCVGSTICSGEGTIGPERCPVILESAIPSHE